MVLPRFACHSAFQYIITLSDYNNGLYRAYQTWCLGKNLLSRNNIQHSTKLICVSLGILYIYMYIYVYIYVYMYIYIPETDRIAFKSREISFVY